MARLRPAFHFSAATLVRVAAGLLVVKFLASQFGPEAFGLLGQLMAFVAVAGMFAGGGTGNGLIKLLAETSGRPELHSRWISAAFTLGVTSSVLIALLLVGVSGFLSRSFLDGYSPVIFICLALTQIVVGAGNLILAEISSRGDSRSYALVNIVGTLAGTVLLIAAASAMGYDGAAYGLVIMPAMLSITAVMLFARNRRALLQHCRFVSDLPGIRRLLAYSTVTLIGAAALPAAQIAIRDALGGRIGWAEVGHWQGVLKISDVYMQFVGVVLINHALPRIASANDLPAAFREYRFVVSVLIGALSIGFLLTFLSKEWIVWLLFAEGFQPMTDLFAFQMTGDLFRTVAAATSFFFLARGMIRVSLVYELMQGVGFLLVFLALPPSAGRMAPVYAHCITYLMLAVCMIGGLGYWLRKEAG